MAITPALGKISAVATIAGAISTAALLRKKAAVTKALRMTKDKKQRIVLQNNIDTLNKLLWVSGGATGAGALGILKSMYPGAGSNTNHQKLPPRERINKLTDHSPKSILKLFPIKLPPFDYACQGRDFESIEAFIDTDVIPENSGYKDLYGKEHSLLPLAIESNRPSLVKKILDKGFPGFTKATDTDPGEILIQAIKSKNLEILKLLINRYTKEQLSQYWEDNGQYRQQSRYQTALTCCLNEKALEMAKILIEAGANIETKISLYDCTLLHLSVGGQGAPDFVKLLIEKKRPFRFEKQHSLIHATVKHLPLQLGF